jgi:hypothetical protein
VQDAETTIFAKRPAQENEGSKTDLGNPTILEEAVSTPEKGEIKVSDLEAVPRGLNHIDPLATLSHDLLEMDLPALSGKDIYQSRSRLPIRWNAIFEVNNYNLKNTSAGVHGGRIGLSMIKPLSPRAYLAVEPMLAWTTDFAEDHLLMETYNYGLEVRSRAYRVKPDLVVSGQVNLHIGWVTGRWKVQTGPSLFALPWARGEVYELDVDQGQWTDIAKVGRGRLESDLSDKWSWGWSGTALYHLTPRWHLGLSVNYQDRTFFQKDHYEGRSDDRLNIGLRTQYLIGS